MHDDSLSPLQIFVQRVLDQSPRKRDHYDSLIQDELTTKGKPIYDIQRGKVAKPGIPTLRAMANALNQPIELFMRALEGEDVHPVPSGRPLDIRHAPDVPLIRSAALNDNMVEITAVDLSYSMGPGTTIDAYIEEEPVKFDIGFLRNITRSPFGRLRLARGVGDSMFPTLVPGDVVMIDTTQNMLNMQDRVYAISLYGAAAIKRLRMVGQGKIEVISDNPAVKDDIVDAEDLAIHGRVIWFARDL